jgi:hypothetical protein
MSINSKKLLGASLLPLLPVAVAPLGGGDALLKNEGKLVRVLTGRTAPCFNREGRWMREETGLCLFTYFKLASGDGAHEQHVIFVGGEGAGMVVG